MCQCPICTFHQVVNHLNIRENHEPQYQQIELLEMANEDLNTSSNMLVINIREHIESGVKNQVREDRLLVQEIPVKAKSNTHAESIVLRVKEELKDAATSLPEIVTKCVEFAISNLEFEIKFSHKQLAVLNNQDLSKQEKMDKLIEMNGERPDYNSIKDELEVIRAAAFK
ncbi:hypothetical protein LMH73_013860 [Vibrio splendidus]|nr:hypothetical protein [Vibrio splendidus]MCC4883063.1 hypothetical protein [Vibrio splendidus]